MEDAIKCWFSEYFFLLLLLLYASFSSSNIVAEILFNTVIPLGGGGTEIQTVQLLSMMPLTSEN